jgi:hypothetical protein
MTQEEIDLIKREYSKGFAFPLWRAIEHLQSTHRFVVLQAPAGYTIEDRVVREGDVYHLWVGPNSGKQFASPFTHDLIGSRALVLTPIPLPTPPPILTCEAPTVESVYGVGWEDLKKGITLPFGGRTEVRFMYGRDAHAQGYTHHLRTDGSFIRGVNPGYRLFFREFKGGV